MNQGPILYTSKLQPVYRGKYGTQVCRNRTLISPGLISVENADVGYDNVILRH
jgi:hypothetical protein